MSNTDDVQEEDPEFDPDGFSEYRHPEKTKATTHVSERYIAPRSWSLLASGARCLLKECWNLTETELAELVTDADEIAIVYFANELVDQGPVAEAAKPAIQQLRDALIDLKELEDDVLSDIVWRIPSLFPPGVNGARITIDAGILITSTLTQARKNGRPKGSIHRDVISATALIKSWNHRTLRDPTPGKRRPSIRSFYTELLPLLRVPSGVRIYPLEEPPYDLFQDSRSFTDRVLQALERELVNSQNRAKIR